MRVLDTGCGSHLVSSMQGLRSSMKVDKGDMDLQVANVARVVALAVGFYRLCLPSSFELILDQCYNVPSLSRNIISISCLVEQDLKFSLIKSKCCSIYLDNIFVRV